MKLLHQPGEIIAQRYRIINTLGQGGIGITYQALDLNTNQQIALKALSLRRMTEWKKIELFEREAQILAQLNHPGIPQYLDYFQVDTGIDRYFYIAQQLAPGKSLAELVENGWRLNESEVKKLTVKILEILVYLQSLTPPVIHRDIKPQNIIITPDNQVFLVDFGSVQDTYHNTVTGGSTIVGTFGYMAPEQCRGQAVLSTDLYGLGNTILFLLTGKSIEELNTHKLKINFRSQVRVSPQFANWLEKILEPAIEDRFTSASVALAVLQGKEIISNYSSTNPYKPQDSQINLRNPEDKLIVEIILPGLRDDFKQMFTLLLLIWNSCILYPCLESLIILFFALLIRPNLAFVGLLPGSFLLVISIFLLLWGAFLRIMMIIRLAKMILFGINNNIDFTKINFNISIFIIDIWILLLLFNISPQIWDYYSSGLPYSDVVGLFIMILIDIGFVLWFQRKFLISSLQYKINLQITPNTFLLTYNVMKQNSRKIEVSTELIKPILSFLGLPMGESPITDISLQNSLSENGFCKLRSHLTQDEKEWLAWEINNYLKDKNINT